MKEGEIRGPVKTQFGYHILKLDGIQPASVKTFEQSKSDLEAEYRRNEAERLFNNAQDQLADAALQNTTDIDVVARKAGLAGARYRRSSAAPTAAATWARSPAVIEAAFSQDVLDGRLSPIVEVEKGRGVVLRATDHKLPQQKPLEAVRTEVVAAWKKQRGTELAAAAAADAVKRLQAGESWEAWRRVLGSHRAAGEIRLARPIRRCRWRFAARRSRRRSPHGKPIYTSVSLANGDAAVRGVERGARGSERRSARNRRRKCGGNWRSKRPPPRRKATPRRRAPTPRSSLNPQALD